MSTFTITKGNSKIQETYIFNLPAKMTCPGATAQCSLHCYAMKAQVQYPSARNSRERNFELVKDQTWSGNFITQLAATLEHARKPLKFFRIHESGDFFNQKYVDQWYQVCKAFPSIQFLAYTKSHHLDFSKLLSLPNVSIRYSVWPDSKKFRHDMPLAIMEGVEEREHTHHCKPGDQCGPCRFCWVSHKDVKFSLH